MAEKGLKNKAFGGVFWKFAERICAQLVSAIVSIVLARILMPDDYSVVSIVSIFFVFCNIFISGGLNTSLIQKKNADELDYSTILFANIGLSVLLYIIMFFLAPVIAGMYHKEILVPIIRVMGLGFFINSVKSVVCAKISKDLDFKKFFWATIIGTVISAFIGIAMALNGFGAWALVAQSMSNGLIDTIILIVVTKIRFKVAFSFERFKPLFKFGSKLMLAEIVSTAYEEIRPLVVGLKFSTESLAFYNKGKAYPQLINSTASDTLSSVLFPVMTRAQDDKAQILAMTRRFIQVCSYVIFPLMLGLFATANNFITILLTAKWQPAVIYVRIFCISHLLTIVQNGNLQPIRAIGRSDVILKLDIIKKSIYAVILVVFIWLSDSPEWLAATTAITSSVAAIINTTANRKLFDYKLRWQIWDLLENFIPAALMCGIVMLIGLIEMNMYLQFVLQVIAGIVVYVGLSIISKNKSFLYLLNFLKELLNIRGKGNVQSN